MKSFIALVALVGVLMIVPQPSQAIPFTATLSGAAESPANSSTATGTATVDLDVVAHLLSVNITFSGLSAPTTAAHIHCCVSPSAATPTVGVATMLPSFTGFPLGVTSGTYSMLFDTSEFSAQFPLNTTFIAVHGGTRASAESALLAGLLAGEAYVNIHTSIYPGGEIRGFLTAPSGNGTGTGSGSTGTVPEPATVWLMATGLAGLAALRRKLAA